MKEMFPTTSSPNSEYYFINTLRDQFDALLSNYTTLDASDWKYPRMNRNDYSELSFRLLGPAWFQCRNDLTAIKKLKPKCNGKVLDCNERHLAIETQPLLNVEMTNEICERAFSSLEKFADRHLKDIATKFLIYVNKSFS
ncbi:hypothetical protein A3Q56_04473 [Intoshia linei]|uniref:Uncharacterized protein n=1 Tax=Intoshia linei TaxID=1819745 RepID=A0A177B2C0_9BILA|nr:hypothetical protein A3Q56_04473 [Intoshia linei]